MHILIVEDDPERVRWFEKEFIGHDLIIEKRPERARRFLTEKKFDIIFLDHDLGDHVYMDSEDELTGYQVSKCIPGSINCKTPVVVHSWNPVGAENIYGFLIKTNTRVVKIPFGMFDKTILTNLGL